ncbi:NifU family protein [Mycobacterium sp. GA-2829]|uniref:NifU family protein n=1 Tax=Mycobacterium sp. GA-2829 TaxID=1772283 RepID=UPI00073FED06|nr:NifU family protein [Mycobacterium sp. GA-2829]KUI20085.1 hypothetical protein AU194_04125 [Mycobacterium sp. GA-2829]
MGASPDREDAQWATAGERIQTLLDASSVGGGAARERAERLVGEVTDLYGAALARLLRLALDAQPSLAEAVAADRLIASLLLVHGLHPHSVERRIGDALDTVRPYLGSHGGDVHLLEVDGATVRLRFSGNCRGCPSSAKTLELAVEDAVRAAAPEIDMIEVVAAAPDSTLIPAESLFTRVRGPVRWVSVPPLDELAPGEIGGFAVAGTVVLACRLGDVVYAYRDRCPTCTRSLAGARLDGGTLGCPRCGAEFDVVAAGTGVGVSQHLDPVPVLQRAGVWSMAIAEEVA